MLSIPLSLFLLLYLFIVLIFLVIYFIHVYHLAATSSVNLLSTAIAVFVGGFMVLIVGFTLLLLSGVDWSASIPLFNPNWFPTTASPKPF